MTDLGDLGGDVAAEVVDVSFGWFGQQIRAHPDATDLLLFDFLERAGDLDERSIEGAQEVKKFAREVIHPDDFDAFWTGARANRVPFDRLFDVVNKVLEGVVAAATDRPTGQPSDSHGGQQSTPVSSADDSSLLVQRRLEAQGRPDLALAVVQAREAQEEARLRLAV